MRAASELVLGLTWQWVLLTHITRSIIHLTTGRASDSANHGEGEAESCVGTMVGLGLQSWMMIQKTHEAANGTESVTN